MRRLWRLLQLLATTIVHGMETNRRAAQLPPEARARYRAVRQRDGTRRLLRIMNVRVTLEGTVPPGGPYLVVSNHIGLLDSIVLASQLEVAFAGKAEIRSWPFLGWVTQTYGVFSVDRERRTMAAAFVEHVQQKMACGVNVLVFPEGRTNKTRRLLPFKTSAFEAMAGREGVVLPVHLGAVSVEGVPAEGPEGQAAYKRVTWADTDQSLAAQAWHLIGLRQVRMRVRVGPPLVTNGQNRKALARQAREAVAALAESPPPGTVLRLTE